MRKEEEKLKRHEGNHNGIEKKVKEKKTNKKQKRK